MNDWRDRNREKAREYGRKYYAENREAYLAKAKEWRETHKAEKAEQNRKYREKMKARKAAEREAAAE